MHGCYQPVNLHGVNTLYTQLYLASKLRDFFDDLIYKIYDQEFRKCHKNFTQTES